MSQTTEQLETKELPRFLQATSAVEEWLSAHAETESTKDPEELADWFGECLKEQGTLSTAAQTLDFVSSMPELGSQAVASATKRLALAIAESGAPAEIVAIYSKLYPEAVPAESAPEQL